MYIFVCACFFTIRPTWLFYRQGGTCDKSSSRKAKTPHSNTAARSRTEPELPAESQQIHRILPGAFCHLLRLVSDLVEAVGDVPDQLLAGCKLGLDVHRQVVL